jgi:gluconokinase
MMPGGAPRLERAAASAESGSLMENRPMESASSSAPAVVVVMGVSGSGKSTVGALLASRLRWEFEDADWFHPAANVDKMHRGIPLTDEDRRPWLAAIAAWIDKTRRSNGHAVIACSALKRRYRDVLIGGRSDVRLVYLKGDETLIARRIATRHEHFMPGSLLHSQFDALEEPGADENPVVISIEPEPREIVAQILSALRLSGDAVPPQQAAPESTAPGARSDPQ